MAKFCNMCGKPLEDGEVCDCQNQPAEQTQAEQGEYTAPQQAVTQPQNQGQFNQGQQQFNQGQFNGGQQFNAGQFNQGPSAASTFFNKILGIVKNPVEEIRNIAYSGDSKDSFILLGVGAALYVIGLIICMLKINSAIGKDAAKELDLPYVKYVVLTAIIFVVMDIIVGAMLYVSTMIVEKSIKPSWTPIWAVVGLKSVYKGIGILAGSIIVVVLPWPGMAVMLAGILVSFVLCVNSYCVIMQLDSVKSTYIQMITIAVSSLLAMFFAYMIIETALDDLISALFGAFLSGKYR